MKKFLRQSLFTLFTCSALFNINNALANTQQQTLQGYWAMKPTYHGLANIAHFDSDKATLYPFTCDLKNQTYTAGNIQQYTYKIEDDTLKIYKNNNLDVSLKILVLSEFQLILEQEIEPNVFTRFESIRTSKISPLCNA